MITSIQNQTTLISILPNNSSPINTDPVTEKALEILSQSTSLPSEIKNIIVEFRIDDILTSIQGDIEALTPHLKTTLTIYAKESAQRNGLLTLRECSLSKEKALSLSAFFPGILSEPTEKALRATDYVFLKDLTRAEYRLLLNDLERIPVAIPELLHACSRELLANNNKRLKEYIPVLTIIRIFTRAKIADKALFVAIQELFSRYCGNDIADILEAFLQFNFQNKELFDKVEMWLMEDCMAHIRCCTHIDLCRIAAAFNKANFGSDDLFLQISREILPNLRFFPETWTNNLLDSLAQTYTNKKQNLERAWDHLWSENKRYAAKRARIEQPSQDSEEVSTLFREIEKCREIALKNS
ncbi:MAG: hypothetical protein JWO53_107 [Chlamydiia bacterium]|nr:hypothetical protein [Chlamydiia bacterium]